jgi:uncharacterized caspase-like protein
MNGENNSIKGPRYALVLASYEYDDPEIRKLNAPRNDAQSLAEILTQPDIGGFNVKTLLNESSGKIRKELEAFFREKTSRDLLLLFFSGHGMKDENGKLYF